MAKDTLSSEKAKKDELNCSKGRTICTRSSASSGSITQEPSGLRRSNRETPSKKPAPLASNSRKSGRLEKQAPSAPSVTRKSERIEKKNAPSPLRRSDRGKSVSSLNSLGSRKSSRNSGASSDIDQKKDKQEKSVKELTNKTRKIKPVMTGRAYRALFIQQPKRSEYLANQHDYEDSDTNQVDDNESDRNSSKDLAETFAQVAHEDPVEQAVSPSTHLIQENGHVEEVSASNAEELGLADSSVMAHGDNDGAEKVGSECQQPENSEPQKLVNGLGSARKDANSPLKWKKNTAEVVLDAPAMVASTSNAEELGVADTFMENGDNDGAENVGSECQRPEKPERQKLVVGLASARKDADSPVKRKKNTAEAVPDAPATVTNSSNACVMSSGGTIPSTLGVADTFMENGDNDGAENVGSECQRPEKPEQQKLVVGLASARKDADSPVKRKKNTAEAVPDAPATVTNSSNACIMSSGGTIPSTYGCKIYDHPETCNTCRKRQKVNYDSTKLTSCSCITKPDLESGFMVQDRRETEAAARTNFGDTNEKTIQQDESLDCKAGSSSYPEYWVPVQISYIQLEQYCATLLSNSLSLCSLVKNDPVRALHDTLISARKTCDHPYVVDQSMQLLLTKNLMGAEILDVGIKASGKLQLLDAMLTEIRKTGSKAVVFFQTIGDSGRGLIGDILDDFMRQRFGEPSYERIDRDVVPSKKQFSMNRFNKESERFVLLLETRACSNSIKLSSVEAFILFDSSWNPLHDLRYIQKIKIESQSERTKMFRLYSPCTVEEKALLLARQNKPVAENPSTLVIHALLMWGASYLFDNLDRFHDNQTPESGVLFEQSIIESVIDEILSILSLKDGEKKEGKRYLILEAKHVQGTYRTDSTLFGEEKVKLSHENSPNTFWTKLLNQRNPTWKYCSVSSQRNRKRVRYSEDSEASAEVGNGGVAKKRKKAAGGSSDPPASHEEKKACGKDQKGASGSPSLSAVQLSSRSASGNISEIPEDMLAGNDSSKGLCESQKSLHAALKPEMAKLCQVLHLSTDGTNVVENFLEYVINNHHVCKEPTTTLQAFQIAVCWVAATLLKEKLKRKESLALAKDHLAYGCSREEVDYIYSMLCCLRSIFLRSQWGSKLDCLPKDSEQSMEGNSNNQVDENISREMLLQEKKNTKKACGTESQAWLSEQKGTEFGSTRNDIDKSIRDIVNKCRKQVQNLLAKHEEAKLELARNYEKENSDLEKSKKAKALVISIAWKAGSTQSKIDELKTMDYDFERKFDQLKSQLGESLKNLEEKHEAERKKLAEKEADWTERIKRWAEKLQGFIDSKIEHYSGIISSNTSGNAPDVAATFDNPVGEAIGANFNHMVCEASPEAVDPLPKAQNSVGTTMDHNSQIDVPEILRNGQEEDMLPIRSSKQQTHDVVTESRSSGPTSATELEILAAADCQEKVAASSSHFSGDQVLDGVTSPAPDEDVTLSRPLENDASEDLPLDREQALLSGENNGASNADSGAILDQRNEETCSLNQESPGETVLPLEHPVLVVEFGGSAVLDQAVQDIRPPSSSLVAIQHDPAPKADSQNTEDAPEPCIAEPDTREVGAAEPCIAEPGTQEVEAADPCIAEPSTREVEAAERCMAEPDTREVEAAEPCIAEQGTRELGAAEPCIAEPDTREVEAAEPCITEQGAREFGAAEPCIAEPGAREVEAAERCIVESNPQVEQLTSRGVLAGHDSESLRRSSNEDVIPQNAETLSHRAENVVEQSATQGALQMPFPLFSDPFQYELEKIRREAEAATKIHEDTKSLLKAELEKKIAELKREYNNKYREADAKFQARVKEIDAYNNLVVMNKYLADAFKTKCSDPNAAPASATSRDTNSDMIQRFVQQSSQGQGQQGQRSSAVPSRPVVASMAPPPSQSTAPAVARPSVLPPHPPPPQSQSPVPPVPRPLATPPQSQSTAPPVPRLLATPPQSQSTVPPIPRPLATPPHSSPPQSQSAVPPAPRPFGPPQRSPLSPMPQSRPPVITNTTPSSAPSPGTTTHVFSRVRAPAPHLQSYRSSSALVSTNNPSSSLPRGTPAQHSFHNPSTCSASPAVANHVPRAPSPACQNSLQARIPRPETGEGSNTTSNPPVSAAEQASAISAPATYSSMLIQQQQEGNSTSGSQSNQDVVCLSDDE